MVIQMNIDINTVKINECVNDSKIIISNIKFKIDDLYKKLNNMPIETCEWTGTSAQKFIDHVNIDKIQYMNLIKNLEQLINILDSASENYTSKASNLKRI